MNVKNKLPGKRITYKDIRKKNKQRKIRSLFLLAKFRCHGSAQDAGLPIDTPRRYPGYYI